MTAILVTLLLFIWAASAFAALPEHPDFSKIPIWRPKHPTLVVLALVLGAIGFYVRYHFPNPNEIDNWFWAFVIDLAPEMVGMAFTVVVIDELNQRRLEQQEKQRIIRQMASSSNDFALDATRQAKEIGILYNGSLQGADLRFANLREALLWRANLKKVDLRGANLQSADLEEADLEGADLQGVNLQGAELSRANLQDAILQEANLEDADLARANLQRASLINSNLSKAKYTQYTKWPEDFDPRAAGAIKGRWEQYKWIQNEEGEANGKF